MLAILKCYQRGVFKRVCCALCLLAVILLVHSMLTTRKYFVKKDNNLGIPKEAIKEDMSFRRNHMWSMCQDYRLMPKIFLTHKWLVSRKHHFMYCPVEKVASTFWRRFIYQLEHTSPMRSPFEISIQTLYSRVDKSTLVHETGDSLRQLLLRSTTRLLFVRDPYNRLFSAYVDKLLAPNPVFWKVWGLPAVREYRKTAEGHGTTASPCGDDVTFREFVRLAVHPRGQSNNHVMAINRLCTPCHVNYTLVGKMETFDRDVADIMAQLGVNPMMTGGTPDDIRRDAVKDSVHDAMSDSWLRSSLLCVSKDDVIQRIWRKLQIRGFISWRINFRPDAKTVAAINGSELSNLLVMAAQGSSNQTELKIQKYQAFLEAYSTIEGALNDDITKVYYMDFELFNYNPYPPELSKVQLAKVLHTGAFDWRKNWNLTAIL